jgi:hypothetical protein
MPGFHLTRAQVSALAPGVAVAALVVKTRKKSIAEVGAGHVTIVCAETALLRLAAILFVRPGGGI